MKETRFPTLDHVWLFAAIALFALRPLLTPIPPHDFWWHMAMGRTIVQTQTIPTTDSFSYTRFGEPFYNQGWLAQVLMYGLHQLGGIPLIIVIQSLVITLTYGLLLVLCIQQSGRIRLSVGLLLMIIMPVSFNNWNVRPQSYAFPLFVTFFLILKMWRTNTHDVPKSVSTRAQDVGMSYPLLFLQKRFGGSNAPLWLLPIMMVLWVNIHGSFVLGGMLIAGTCVGEWVRRVVEHRFLHRAPPHDSPPLKHLFLWGAITAAAILVNPRGFGVLGYVQNLLSTSAVTNLVTEWAPPTIRDTGGLIFFLFLMLCALVFAYTCVFPDPVDVFILLPILWLSLGATRNIVWFAMMMTPLLGKQVSSWFVPLESAQKQFQGLPRMNGVVIGFMALLVVLGLPWIKPSLGLPPELGDLLDPETPVPAVEFLKHEPHRPSHLYHAMSYGSYLIWEMPDQRVFADPRIELYPFAQWQDYININAGNNVQPILDKYNIDGLLLNNKEQAGLLRYARNDSSWVMRYEDEQTTYFVKR